MFLILYYVIFETVLKLMDKNLYLMLRVHQTQQLYRELTSSHL